MTLLLAQIDSSLSPTYEIKNEKDILLFQKKIVFSDLQQHFLLNVEKNTFPLIEFFLNNWMKILIASKFKEIIRFVNLVLGKYNFLFSRSLAYSRKIEDFPEILKDFSIFKEAWNFLQNIENQKLYFTCHPYPWCPILESDPIASILQDSSFEGKGMIIAAGLYTLARMHNDLIENINAIHLGANCP